ncbi:hypothetical protein [Marivirga sp.]|uniref:hypothetical protein n=1 Tax=Marivirga sp. TaxID=2018662 RepID=UPI0025D34113|nr:hypothetical protein [Marivirga sp.]
MSKRLQKRVNGGLAIYFGIGSLLAAVMFFILLLVNCYKAIFMANTISWDMFLFIILGTLISGGMAYALLRIGYSEIEN